MRAVLLLALLMAGCATTQNEAQDRADKLSLAYSLLRLSASAYVALPPCKQDGPAICSNPEVSAEIVRAIAVTDPLVAEARKNILLAGTDPSKIDQAYEAGRSAITIFASVVSAYGVR